MHERLRDWLLNKWAKVVCDHPRWVLFVALAVTVGSVLVTVDKLQFQADRNDLISRDIEWNQWFINWRKEFSGQNDFYVVVDVGSAQLDDAGHGLNSKYRAKFEKAKLLVDELGPAILECESVKNVVWGFPGSEFSPRAIRVDHWAEFVEFTNQMQEAKLLLASDTPGGFLQAAMAEMGSRAREKGGVDLDLQQTTASIRQIDRVIKGFGEVVRNENGDEIKLADIVYGEENPLKAWRYMMSPNGRLMFLRVTPRREMDVINAPAIAIGEIRQVMKEVGAKHPGVEFGLTGIEVVEADETTAATRDSIKASILAVVLIAVLLVAAFHSLRTPLLLVISLLTGVAWSFGFLTIAVGHLQVISVVFTVILMGLGIAYGIHLASSFEMLRHDYADNRHGFARTMGKSFRSIGPGVVTGAVTTAVAFGMTLLTDFKGVAEMGLIAGVGVLLCLVAMFSVFPAMMRIFRSGNVHVKPLADRWVTFFKPEWVGPFVRYPRVTLLVAFVLTVGAMLATSKMTYDFDLLKLQPDNVDSVIWQERIVRDGNQSIWAATSIAYTLEQAKQRKQEFLQLDSVSTVGGIGYLYPDDDAKKIARLKEVRAALGDSLDKALQVDEGEMMAKGDGDVLSQLMMMRLALAAAGLREMPDEIRGVMDEVNRSINEDIVLLQGMSEQAREAGLRRLQKAYFDWRKETAKQLSVALDGKELTPEDLSPKLLEPYISVGKDGHKKYALEIQPKIPGGNAINGPLDPKFLPGFMQDLERIDPMVTGVIAQIYRSGDLIRDSYILAGCLALGAVFILVLLDFRSLGDALLSLLPVAVGFAITFGVMWVLRMKINPANIIVLPLMFGIGVDAGVHVLHRYRHDPVQRPLGLTHGTGKGITITSLTSMIGFGVMLIGHHRGIRSLGFVMFVGIGMTMLACWTVMPAWLEVVRGKNSTKVNV